MDLLTTSFQASLCCGCEAAAARRRRELDPATQLLQG